MSKEPKRNVYVGHRYVPKIMGEWDKSETYEGLSIVTNEGTSYTSKKRVPKGIDILNEEYWVVTGNYNAQIEEYRKDVREMEKEVGKKSDQSYVDNLNEKVTTQLAQIAISISEFGAVGDGITDDYDAFMEATEYFKEKGGGTLILEPKTYLLDRYLITGGENQNDVKHIVFEDLVGFTLEGNGATIIKKGDFKRTHDYDQYGYKRSYVQGLNIDFKTCDDLTVRNLTVDGQVQQTTRDTGLAEAGGYGVRLSGCRNVTLENVNSNYHTMDGFSLFPSGKQYGGIRRICRNVRLINCKSIGNSRQGLTAGHFVDLYIENCDFSDTGKAEGAFGRTAPGLGIDFEMDYSLSVVEEHSRGAVIKNTRINNNYNTISMFNSSWKDITFINCEMKNDYVGSLNDISINGSNIKLINCTIDISDKFAIAYPNTIITDTTLRNCDIKCRQFSAHENVNLVVKLIDNIINGSVYINVVNKQSFSIGNTFKANASVKTGDTYMYYWRLKYLAFSRDNTFITDLTTEGSFFASDYENTDIVVGDVYTTDHVRPSWNSETGIRVYNKGID